MPNGALAGLTIVRIDSRSAGTYDGTFYARATIYNGSGKTLHRVNANGTPLAWSSARRASRRRTWPPGRRRRST
jgi:hypothetical protein